MLLDWLLRAVSPRRIDAPGSVPEGVAVRESRWIPVIGGKLSGMRGPAAAVTLGRTIVVHPDVKLTERLVRHELEHVRQWQSYPATFPVRYVLAHLRHGYTDNPFEVDARAAERRDDDTRQGGRS